MNPCQPWSPVSYIVYQPSLAYYFFGKRWRVGDGLNRDGGRLRVRVTCTKCHQIMSSGVGMRSILNRAKKFSENKDNRFPYTYV